MAIRDGQKFTKKAGRKPLFFRDRVMLLTVVVLVLAWSSAQPVSVHGQGQDVGQLMVDIFNEAAGSMGWNSVWRASPANVHSSNGQTQLGITVLVNKSDAFCGNRSNNVVITYFPTAAEAGQYTGASFNADRTEPFHGLTASRKTNIAPHGNYKFQEWIAWPMGNYAFVIGDLFDCPAEGLPGSDLNPIPLAEAIYAAAVHHGLAQEATPTPAPLAGYSLQGIVTDGHKDPLRYVPVWLTYGKNEQMTITDKDGRYQFTDLPNSPVAGFNPEKDTYRVKVELQYTPSGAPLYQVLYGSDKGPLVAPVTKTFSLPSQPGVVKYDIDFGNLQLFQIDLLEKVDAQLPARLPDLAASYFHVSQAIDLADELNQEISRPFNVVAFNKGPYAGKACWYGRSSNGAQDWNGCMNLSNKQYAIAFGEQTSLYTSRERPSNREWHEFGHHFLADAFGGLMPSYKGRQNHQGYYVNTRSTDAWTEGFAEFFSTMVARQITGDADFEKYEYGSSSTANLEFDYKSWLHEEFAVASLLLDLVDDDQDYPTAKDDDNISIPVEDVWTIISKGVSTEVDGNGHVFDMLDLYQNLIAYDIGSEDLNNNGRPDLNDLFIAHGFFDDSDGDHKYKSGDRIGYTSHPQSIGADGKPLPAMPDRRNQPNIPGSAVAVSVDNPPPGVVYKINILLDPPYSYLGFSYTVPAEELPDGRLYLILPPADYPARVRITAQADGYEESAPLEISAADFWAKVPNPDDPSLLSHTFTLKSSKFGITPSTFVGVAELGLCGLAVLILIGIIVLVRRKPSARLSPPYAPAYPAPAQPKTPWITVFLVIGIVGLCCLAAAVGGWFLWSQSITPEPSATTFIPSPVPATVRIPPPSVPPISPVVPIRTPSETPAQPAADTILYQDDFSNPESGWTRQIGQTVTDYKDDNYSIQVTEPNTIGFGLASQDFGDVRMEVDTQKKAGSDDNDHGLICRLSEDNGLYNYYFFVISSQGYAAIGKTVKNEAQYLWSEKVKSAGLVKAGTAINHLRADCKGNTLTLYINGTQVASVNDAAFTGGDVGLLARTQATPGTEILFDNFVVYKP